MAGAGGGLVSSAGTINPDGLVMGVNSIIGDYSTPASPIASSDESVKTNTTTKGTPLYIGLGTTFLNQLAISDITKMIKKITLDFVINAGGNIKIAIYDSIANVPTNLLGSEAFAIGAGTGEKTYTLTTPITPTAVIYVAIICDTSGNQFDGDAVGHQRQNISYASFPSDPFSTSSTAGNAPYVEVIHGTGSYGVNGVISDNSDYWESETETNPHIYIDAGSQKLIDQIALDPHVNTTETEIKIQVSNDAIAWENVRTITYSDLIEGVNNFIRFNLQNTRYIRVYGNSGSSVALAINEIKYLPHTNDNVAYQHGHILIDPSDTALGLDGL